MRKKFLHIDNKVTKRWYLNGNLHREDGPAKVWASGEKYWYVHGKLHREDGPAVERVDGIVEWWLNDVCLGRDAKGFWMMWEKLTPEQQNNLNLHLWMAKYT